MNEEDVIRTGTAASDSQALTLRHKTKPALLMIGEHFATYVCMPNTTDIERPYKLGYLLVRNHIRLDEFEVPKKRFRWWPRKGE